jgi:MFS family permease
MTANGHFAGGGEERGLSGPLPGARSALTLLLVINLFNYIDRQVLAAVEPQIRREMFYGGKDETNVPKELQAEAKFKSGLLSMAFVVSYMLIAPLFGWLGDRTSRWMLVGIGVGVWSLASGASGWDWGVPVATAYTLLLITRCFVGVGEGAYGPVAPTMLSDLYPVAQRGQVMAWFYLAIPVGGALGYAVGEIVQRSLDWRWAFYVLVPPGMVLALWCFFMREPPRGRADAVETSTPRKTGWRDYVALFKIPSYTLNTMGMAGMTFAIGALAWWMPDYLEEERVDDVLGIGPKTFFGVVTAVAGLIATLLGGLIGDWLRPRWSGSYFIVSGIALCLGFPMVVLMVNTPFPLAWIFVFLAVFCLFFNTGPTNTILANVTHPSVRASAFAINILIIHALGDALSPPLIGYISGLTSRAFGFIVVSVMMLVGRLLWLWGARYLERDTARVLTSLPPEPK